MDSAWSPESGFHGWIPSALGVHRGVQLMSLIRNAYPARRVDPDSGRLPKNSALSLAKFCATPASIRRSTERNHEINRLAASGEGSFPISRPEGDRKPRFLHPPRPIDPRPRARLATLPEMYPPRPVCVTPCNVSLCDVSRRCSFLTRQPASLGAVFSCQRVHGSNLQPNENGRGGAKCAHFRPFLQMTEISWVEIISGSGALDPTNAVMHASTSGSPKV